MERIISGIFTVYVCIAALYINTGAGCLLSQT